MRRMYLYIISEKWSCKYSSIKVGITENLKTRLLSNRNNYANRIGANVCYWGLFELPVDRAKALESERRVVRVLHGNHSNRKEVVPMCARDALLKIRICLPDVREIPLMSDEFTDVLASFGLRAPLSFLVPLDN